MLRRSLSFLLLLVSLAFLVLTLTSTAYGQVEDEGEIIAEEEEREEKSKDLSAGVKSGLQPCQLDYLLRKLGEECPKIRDDQIMSLEHTIDEIANNMQAIGAIINQDKDIENIQDDSSQIWQDFGGPAISILPDADYLNVVNITVPGEISDCADAFAKDHKKPGVYLIHPVASPYKVHLLCIDGWTVIQRRFDGSENFHRSFDEYLAGFGNFSGEFFAGLENLHRLTFSQAYTLRVDVKSAAGKWYFAVFDSFAITDETDQFRLKLGNMTAGNSDDVMEQSRDKPFSSFDRDNDEWSGGNCAKHFRGGWWSGNCVTNLNQGWCKSGCLRWGSTRVLSSIMRIRPSSSASPDDMTETPDPVAFSLEK